MASKMMLLSLDSSDENLLHVGLVQKVDASFTIAELDQQQVRLPESVHFRPRPVWEAASGRVYFFAQRTIYGPIYSCSIRPGPMLAEHSQVPDSFVEIRGPIDALWTPQGPLMALAWRFLPYPVPNDFPPMTSFGLRTVDWPTTGRWDFGATEERMQATVLRIGNEWVYHFGSPRHLHIMEVPSVVEWIRSQGSSGMKWSHYSVVPPSGENFASELCAAVVATAPHTLDRLVYVFAITQDAKLKYYRFKLRSNGIPETHGEAPDQIIVETFTVAANVASSTPSAVVIGERIWVFYCAQNTAEICYASTPIGLESNTWVTSKMSISKLPTDASRGGVSAVVVQSDFLSDLSSVEGCVD